MSDTYLFQFNIKLDSQVNYLFQLVNIETSRLKRMARVNIDGDHGDCRLHHIAIYIILNDDKNSDTYIHLSITEQFLVPELDDIPKYVTLYNFVYTP